MRSEEKRGIPGHMKGMGMKQHALSGRSPHNKANAINLSRDINKRLQQEAVRNEKWRKRGLVSRVRDLFS